MVGSCINSRVIERMSCIEGLVYARDWAKAAGKTLHKLVEISLVKVGKLHA